MCPEALKLYRSKLSAFEQTELPDFPEIYFLGLEAKKIEGVPGGAQNNGYDDENGSYIKVRLPLHGFSGRNNGAEKMGGSSVGGAGVEEYGQER